MPISLKHKFESLKGDGIDPTYIQPSNWNDEHDLLIAGAKLLGRADPTDGVVQEVTVGSGLTLDAGTATLSAPPVTVAANRLRGRTTAGTGPEEDIEVGDGLRLENLKLSNTGTVPVGTLVDYVGLTAPAGWVLCYGQELSKVAYPALAAVCLETYGTYTDGSGAAGTTHFRLPDYRGRVSAGKDNMGGTAADRLVHTGDGSSGLNGRTLGAAGGVDRILLTTDSMPLHGHPTRMNDESGANINLSGGLTVSVGDPQTFPAYKGVVSNTQGQQIGGTGGDKPHPNVQPTIIANKIVFTGVYPAPI